MVGRAARRLGVSVPEYREIEAGERLPIWETFEVDTGMEASHGRGRIAPRSARG